MKVDLRVLLSLCQLLLVHHSSPILCAVATLEDERAGYHRTADCSAAGSAATARHLRAHRFNEPAAAYIETAGDGQARKA